MRMEPVQPQAADGEGISLRQPDPCREALATPDRERALALVARLRAHIERIEGSDRSHRPDRDLRGRTRREEMAWTLGLEAIDQMLPPRGLVRHGIHDVAPAAYGDFPAASGFALALALRRLADDRERRPLLWCRLGQEVREYGRLYGHGLEGLGLSRQRLLTVTLQKPVAQLWTMEEALKSGALAVVIGDMPSRHTDLTVTRRLALAAQAGKCAGLLLFTQAHEGATASHTRWRVGTARSQAPPFDASAPGAPAWALELTRVRSGRPGSWIVYWHREDDEDHGPAYRFHLAAGFSGGALSARTAQGGRLRAAAKPALRAG